MPPLSGRILTLTTLLFLLTGCRQDQLTLPVTHAAVAQPQLVSTATRAARRTGDLKPGSSCFAFIPLRPQQQRADAVQERLRQTDEMSATLDAKTVTVDLIGDHANVLSLEFPVNWPAPPFYAQRVSTIVERYFSASDVQDDLCNAGFAAVKLSLRSLNDQRLHQLWTARVTTEGLLKQGPSKVETATLQGQ
jgi:hypothetical protein